MLSHCTGRRRGPGTRAEFPRFARGSSQSSLCPPALRRLCRQGMPVCPGLLRGSPLGNIPRKSVAGALALGIFVCHQRLNSTPTCGVKSFPDKGEDIPGAATSGKTAVFFSPALGAPKKSKSPPSKTHKEARYLQSSCHHLAKSTI
ncbi:uncharacterized protein LOC120499636 isoform X2 [Passer montanus]|uniref:uncharacterized protein LOC120499636 isoform X2 n=1 Tax=Passer montanus TaxID=9160 RepID=UPI00195FCEA8|nr:uncharacterized protein LOC120499636 isoform X2 [Passer montanus]